MIANRTGSPPVPAASEAAAPDWFARGRVFREARAVAHAARAVEESQSDEESHIWRRIAKWLVGGAAAGYGLSLLFHLALLTIFSIVFVNLGRGGHVINTEVGIADEAGNELLDTRAFEVSTGMEGAEVAVVESLPLDSLTPDLSVAEAFAPDIKGIADGAGEDAVTTPGSGDDLAFELPKGGNAIQKGSFSAWTEPADPRVGQDYIIVIEVTLPEQTKRYSKSDLVGQLKGTDGYKIKIPDGTEWNGARWSLPRRTPAFRRNGEKARIVFFVRGAHQALVRDTIQIRSRLLDESQDLQIVF